MSTKPRETVERSLSDRCRYWAQVAQNGGHGMVHQVYVKTLLDAAEEIDRLNAPAALSQTESGSKNADETRG